jgi:hypothetical protein
MGEAAAYGVGVAKHLACSSIIGFLSFAAAGDLSSRHDGDE